MSDLPSRIRIHEEGPREGFQIEPGPISSAFSAKCNAPVQELVESACSTPTCSANASSNRWMYLFHSSFQPCSTASST